MSSQTMRCPKCGEDVPRTENVCPYCGESFTGSGARLALVMSADMWIWILVLLQMHSFTHSYILAFIAAFLASGLFLKVTLPWVRPQRRFG
jgi:predicted amidophosphoribosyltransferase